MRILSAIQSIFAAAFLLSGLVALAGIGITGLLFLVPGVVFAVTAAINAEGSRAAVAVALAADAVLAYVAARKLAALLNPAVQGSGVLDYVVPAAALVLVAVGAIAVVLDWRGVRNARWL